MHLSEGRRFWNRRSRSLFLKGRPSREAREGVVLDVVLNDWPNLLATVPEIRAFPKRGLTLGRQVDFIGILASPERARPLFQLALSVRLHRMGSNREVGCG